MQCEAFCCVRMGSTRRYKPGERRMDARCQNEATHRHDGRSVCWTHWMAARNPNRNEPVRFTTPQKVKVR